MSVGSEKKRVADLPLEAKIRLIGELSHLMLCSDLHRGYRVDDIERLFFRPIELGQFRFWRRKDALTGIITWAFLSEEAEQRYLENASIYELQDWNSGDQLWFIDVLAPFGDFYAMVQDMQTNIFQRRSAKFLRVGRDGVEPKVSTIQLSNQFSLAKTAEGLRMVANPNSR